MLLYFTLYWVPENVFFDILECNGIEVCRISCCVLSFKCLLVRFSLLSYMILWAFKIREYCNLLENTRNLSEITRDFWRILEITGQELASKSDNHSWKFLSMEIFMEISFCYSLVTCKLCRFLIVCDFKLPLSLRPATDSITVLQELII